MDKCPSMTSEEDLTAHAATWAWQFRDDFEVLKAFEGDAFVCAPKGNLRKVFSTHVDFFCALDLSGARCWIRAIPPPGTRRELGEVVEKETQNPTVQEWRMKCMPCFWAARKD